MTRARILADYVSSGDELALKAPLASPTFTGTPLTTTASAATNTTQIASTAYVRTEVTNLVDSAPAALDTPVSYTQLPLPTIHPIEPPDVAGPNPLSSRLGGTWKTKMCDHSRVFAGPMFISDFTIVSQFHPIAKACVL